MNNSSENPLPEETQTCDNCHQSIEKSRFRLHYMGCLRQNRVKQPPPKEREESKEDSKKDGEIKLDGS